MAFWKRSLRQRNLAARTIETYVDSGTQLAEWLASEQRIADVDAVTRDHVADFVTHLLETKSASTASVRFRALQQLFKWPESEIRIGQPAENKVVGGAHRPRIPFSTRRVRTEMKPWRMVFDPTLRERMR